MVPATRIEGISPNDFIRAADPDTKEAKPVIHRRGTFVYRLAGRERQQSASYYSPEVLTRFVVGQALEELLDQDGEKTSARAILDLTVCEPALGSGAFAIEAVQQLAEQYLSRRQDELDQRIDPEEYAAELQKVKAYIALHQVYGVDLNATGRRVRRDLAVAGDHGRRVWPRPGSVCTCAAATRWSARGARCCP